MCLLRAYGVPAPRDGVRTWVNKTDVGPSLLSFPHTNSSAFGPIHFQLGQDGDNGIISLCFPCTVTCRHLADLSLLQRWKCWEIIVILIILAITIGPKPSFHPVSFLPGNPLEGKENLPVTCEGCSGPVHVFRWWVAADNRMKDGPSFFSWVSLPCSYWLEPFPLSVPFACNLLQVEGYWYLVSSAPTKSLLRKE